MAYYAVHTPIQAREDLTKKYEAKPTTNQKNPKYAAMVESVDHAVGQLMDTLEDLGIAPLAKQRADTLSGGESRRLEIARALVMEPKFMLLDEPFAGVDPIKVENIQAIIHRLRERGLGVLITDHNVRETLSITDHAYIMSEGKILKQGTAAFLAQDPEARRIYLGERFRLD